MKYKQHSRGESGIHLKIKGVHGRINLPRRSLFKKHLATLRAMLALHCTAKRFSAGCDFPKTRSLPNARLGLKAYQVLQRHQAGLKAVGIRRDLVGREDQQQPLGR